MPLQPVTFQDFHGGQADRYIGTDITRSEFVQNLLIDETYKPYCRYGTSIFAARAPFSAGSTVPSGIYVGAQPYSHPVSVVGPHAYVMNESNNWTEILGYNTTFLPTKTDSVRENAILWRRQIVTVAPVTSLPPAVIYCTNFVEPGTSGNAATYQAVTLGLPGLATIPIDAAYDAADAYQAVYAFFYKFTFLDYMGTLFEFVGNPNNPGFMLGSADADPSSDNIAITVIPTLANTTLTNYDVSTRATTNTVFTSGSTTATVTSATGIVKGAQLVFAAGATNYVPPGTVVIGISGTTLTLSQPATASGSGISVKYSTLTIQIYRTINGGTVLFYTDQIANGTTTYTDAIADATIQLNQSIYTSGNALGYDQPPLNALAVTQTNDFFWYATTSTLYQSIQGAPGACPSSLSDQIDQHIIGLSDILSFPILYCDKSVYRVEGTFDSFGNNGFALREISKTAGCICNASVVKTPYGLFWFGNGGVFYTDGYKAQKVTRHLNQSYQRWANTRVTGAYDPIGNFVYWTINTSQNPSSPNDAWLVLHLNFGISEEMAFSTLASPVNLYPSTLAFASSNDLSLSDPSVTTTATWTSGLSIMVVSSASGIVVGQTVTAVGVPYGTTVTGIASTTITLSNATNQAGTAASVTFSQTIYSQFNNRMIFHDANGFLLWFDPNSLTDVKINTSLYPVSMVKETVRWHWITAGLDQSISGFRKYNPDVSLELDASTPVAAQIRHRRDDAAGWSGEGGSPPSGRGTAGSPGGGTSGNPGAPEIRQDGAVSWNLTDCVWLSDPDEHLWDALPSISGKRSVPAGQLRSSRRQLWFTNAFTIVCASDVYGTATVAIPGGGLFPSFTLDTAGKIWMSDLEGYWITVASDEYVQTYYVISRESDTVIRVTDPFGLLVAGSTKWEIKGFRKFERPRILNYTLYAEVEGSTFGQSTAPIGANT